MKTVDRSGFFDLLDRGPRPALGDYYAMYSSLWEAVVTDPALMLLPIDDHIVHRGDGVFETFKGIEGALYNLPAHLNRLMRSASAIHLRWPEGKDDIEEKVLGTARVAGRPDVRVRVILARGPGSFGISPHEAPTPALYIVVYASGEPLMRRRPQGVLVRRSTIAAKPIGFANVKNCNYLPNVMMKREAHDWDVDFVVGFDAEDHLTEGPTENAGIVTRDGFLAFPRPESILEGTTMARLLELAVSLVDRGVLRGIQRRDISEDDLRNAAEMLIVGTTNNVVAVRMYEDRPIGSGKPGPVFAHLSSLLEQDMRQNSRLRTPFL